MQAAETLCANQRGVMFTHSDEKYKGHGAGKTPLAVSPTRRYADMPICRHADGASPYQPLGADFASTLYSTCMSLPPLLSLHRYFVAAARMQHHFESNLVPFEEPHGTVQDPNREALELFAGPRGNFMYYWYGSLYVVVEGFHASKLHDPRLTTLLRSPNTDRLRDCWMVAFHFQPDYFSRELLEATKEPDFVRWVRELMTAFRAHFERQLVS